MKLWVGLGNPGKSYSLHRHNAGFKSLDYIANEHKFGKWETKDSIEISKGNIDNIPIIMIKPQACINRSGLSVAQISRFYSIDVNDILVFHDDIDFNLGDIRMKTGGGSAGHNGLKDIDRHIGNDYHRIRIGVGRPEDKDILGWVLSDFDISPYLRRISALSRNFT